MNKSKRSIATIIMMIFALFSTVVASTAAWFIVTSIQIPPVVSSGSAILTYFESGNGSKDEPYVIARPKQLYNFSWLQAKGAFSEKTYFELGNDIDMAGKLTGGDTASGAIPPIGTTSNPFVGNFDGKGYKISNLWVSSDPSDWKERPANLSSTDVENDIGFFGRCGNETDSANITNFYLENIEVTNHKSGENVSVGLVAGFADCDISKVGVINGKISIKNANTTCGSAFALIGKTEENVVWTDLPKNDGGTGELIVDPTNDPTCNINSGKNPVPNSITDSAFYIGSLTRTTPSPQASGVWVYNKKEECVFNGSKNSITINNSNSTQIIRGAPGTGYDPATSLDKNEMIDDRFEEIYGNATGGLMKIKVPSNTPGFNSATSEKTYPTNCIWFKPQNYGDACVAFIRQTQASDESMSCYRFKRKANGSYDSTTLQELEFVFQAKALGNGGVAYFEFPISSDDVKDGYEYAIGRPSVWRGKKDDIGFVFLKLAGTDKNNDKPDGSANVLEHIDFVNATGVFDNPTYKIHKTVLHFECISNGPVYYYMNATSDNSKVQYTTQGTPALSDNITTSPQSVQVAYSSSVYPPRRET